MKVKLKRNYNRIAPGKTLFLTPSKVYDVIGIECDEYRIINDRKDSRLGDDPVLYSPELFDVCDPAEPPDWISRVEDGNRYAYPPELNPVGFWEDYHDGVPLAVEAFKAYMIRTGRQTPPVGKGQRNQ
jgi:hypothetical protein